jgi:hypothetical protein
MPPDAGESSARLAPAINLLVSRFAGARHMAAVSDAILAACS